MSSSKTSALALVLALACAGVVKADIWKTGDAITYIQDDWGGDPSLDSGAALLLASYDTVYASTFGVTFAGSISGSTMAFTDADSVQAYLPASGAFKALNGSVLNPISTVAGRFGGEVLALHLNVDFSDAGLLVGASGIPFGDLLLENFNILPAFNGLTVRQFMAEEDTCLGTGLCTYNLADPDFQQMIVDMNRSFYYGGPTPFAQDHLVGPESMTTSAVPEPSSLPLVISVAIGLGWRLRRVVGTR